ncbi:MAG: MBL fold metallo-hydrolase [Clostridia bacterium]|nr:MBL fold metallo-hydrolase [Clostridia bacterium]
MKIQVIALGDYQANCYILTDEKENAAAVVDPGVASDELNDILLGYDLKYILLTHGHFDHIYGSESLKSLYPDAKLCIHEADEICLNNNDYNLVGSYSGYLPELQADMILSNGDEIVLSDKIKLTVVHTPGHSRGSVCYVDYENNYMFSGDTLFCRTVGRVDFLGSNPDDMFDSIKLLSTFDPEMVVYPGHNRATTIGEEKVKNRYMRKL